MSERDEKEAIDVGRQFWRSVNERMWDEARSLLSEDFEAYRPQSREKIVGPDNFIAINREYPGRGTVQVQNARYGYDCRDKTHEVTMATRIHWEKPNGSAEELYAISFFEIDREGLITSATEYWANTYPAPDWRRKYVELY